MRTEWKKSLNITIYMLSLGLADTFQEGSKPAMDKQKKS